jgi:hypothetical protein
MKPDAMPSRPRWMRQTPDGDLVCEHGTASDVHCCNCHSGFLFDIETCVCVFGEDDPSGTGTSSRPSSERIRR